MERFEGFSSDSIQFLRSLRDNNRKEWFDRHKADYQEYLLRPLQALVAELGPFMLSIDPDFDVTPALNRTISRIYRDIRFTRDKSPYKTRHWIAFKCPKAEWQDYPAFFFEISPDSYRYGMGFYCASRQTMDNFRNAVDSDPGSFLSAAAFYPQQTLFTIEGEQYKRPLKADIPGELREWYNRKNLHLICNQRMDGSGIDRRLLPELRRGFATIAPVYHFLCTVAA